MAALGINAAFAADNVITLDLTKASIELTFNETNGSWTGTFDDDATTINSQVFSFVHGSMGSYQTWWGFTASNSADNSYHADAITYQYSNMAKGGIVLNEDGTVKTDKFGAPVVSADVPYMVSYCSTMMAKHPAQVLFNDGKSYEAVGVYVNLNSYAFYSIAVGDGFARAFTEKDKFTLSVVGVAPDETEKKVDVTLASFENGMLSVCRGWQYVDLTPLGRVNEIYFRLKSTDAGTYGDNTPDYFCLDKLMVKDGVADGVNTVEGEREAISYDINTHVATVAGARFAMVCDVCGNILKSGETGMFDLSDLPSGVYIIKAGNSTRKVVR